MDLGLNNLQWLICHKTQTNLCKQEKWKWIMWIVLEGKYMGVQKIYYDRTFLTPAVSQSEAVSQQSKHARCISFSSKKQEEAGLWICVSHCGLRRYSVNHSSPLCVCVSLSFTHIQPFRSFRSYKEELYFMNKCYCYTTYID